MSPACSEQQPAKPPVDSRQGFFLQKTPDIRAGLRSGSAHVQPGQAGSGAASIAGAAVSSPVNVMQQHAGDYLFRSAVPMLLTTPC